jgi:hypothetical protein
MRNSNTCSVGYCAKFNSGYQGDGDTCTYALRNGICPICGGPVDKKYDFGKPIQQEIRQHTGYFIGQYPVIIKLFPDRKRLNFFRWLWASTNLFQRIRIGTFERCRLGYCAVDKSNYAGGDGWVIDMLRHGRCPHCGNPTEQKYMCKI